VSGGFRRKRKIQLMHKGTVKWFDSAKGFGRIIRDDDESEVFVHFTGIIAEGYKSLTENDKVEFEIESGEKGPKAIKVQKV